MIAEFVQSSVPVYAFAMTHRAFPGRTHGTDGRTFTSLSATTLSHRRNRLRIGVGLRNPYELESTPGNTAHDGDYRTVKVELIAHPLECRL